MTINQDSGLIYPSYFSILTCYHPNQILHMGISTNEICINSLQLQYNTQNDYCFIKKHFSHIAILERITSAFYYTFCNLNQFVNHSIVLFA